MKPESENFWGPGGRFRHIDESNNRQPVDIKIFNAMRQFSPVMEWFRYIGCLTSLSRAEKPVCLARHWPL
jgi:hypothetical protein